MSTIKLEELFGNINPQRNLLNESIETVKRIDEIINKTLPYLKSRLMSNKDELSTIGLLTIDSALEIDTAIAKSEKALSEKLTPEIIE